MKYKFKKMILLLSWRDIKHSQSGGAEIFTTEMLQNEQLKNDYRIIHFSTRNSEEKKIEIVDDVTYIRKGNPFTVIFFAILFYFKYRARIICVIDQVNTHRFFTPFWVPKNKRVFFIHQMTREIWKMKLPKPFGWLGESSENWMTKMYKNNYTLTVSNSTRKDLLDLNFDHNKIIILPEGVSHKPLALPLKIKNNKNHIFLYVGRYSEYKGLTDTLEAFAEVCQAYPHSQLVIIGKKNEDYIQKFMIPILKNSGLQKYDQFDENQSSAVFLLDRVSEDVKLKHMENANTLIYPSRREGWGLSVTEAAILGTPSIVYNSPGLIDAVDQGQAGFLCLKNTKDGLRDQMANAIQNVASHEEMRQRAYQYSLQFRWENTAHAFYNFIKEKQDVA